MHVPDAHYMYFPRVCLNVIRVFSAAVVCIPVLRAPDRNIIVSSAVLLLLLTPLSACAYSFFAPPISTIFVRWLPTFLRQDVS